MLARYANRLANYPSGTCSQRHGRVALMVPAPITSLRPGLLVGEAMSDDLAHGVHLLATYWLERL